MNWYTDEILAFWRNLKSEHVLVNKEKLSQLVQFINERHSNPAILIVVPNWRLENMLPENDRTFVNHIFYQSAINFAFTHFEEPYEKFEVEDEKGKFSGAMAMSRCFYREFGENPIDADRILEISSSLENMKKFFQGKNLPPLLEWRQQNLQEAARVVKEKFKGEPTNILKKADWGVERVIEILMHDFPVSFGADHYALFDLAFNKRIQLWLLLYEGRACDSLGRIPKLDDPQEIGPVADYQVARALRVMGILEYSKKLDQKIANQELIVCGSHAEVEIRAATVFFFFLLMKLTGLSIMEIDNFLWREGRKTKDLNHHLTRTTAY